MNSSRLIGLILVSFLIAGCGNTTTTSTETVDTKNQSDVNTVKPSEISSTGMLPGAEKAVTPSGLKIEDITVGTGAQPKPGQTVTVHYEGRLTNGNIFDSSRERSKPFSFQLGAGQVIAGWDEGVATMRVGGKRKLTIPPDLAYGDKGFGDVIPPGSTLVFEVELLQVQ